MIAVATTLMLIDLLLTQTTPAAAPPTATEEDEKDKDDVAPTVRKRSSQDFLFMKRQAYDPNPNIVPTIPGCHDKWIAFLSTWYMFCYGYSFVMIPVILGMFVVTLLTVNHLYMD